MSGGKRTMRIGVISDTHGRLDSQVLEEFRSVARILHAGDVGSEEVLLELSAVAQVIAVRGNVDGFPLTTRLREAEVVELAGVRLLIVHEEGRPENPLPEVRKLLDRHAPDLVIFGHTHQACDVVAGGVRFFNPGAAGPRRFGRPRTIALMEISAEGEVEARLLTLDDEAAGGGAGRRQA